MVVLCDVQHRRLSFRSVTRLSLVGSWSPPSTYQGSGVRQSYGVREAFWEPCSVARRAASATISDFRIRDLGWCNALSLHCVCAVFRRRAGVPICFTSLSLVCVWQAVRGDGVVSAHSATSSGYRHCVGVRRRAVVARIQEICTGGVVRTARGLVESPNVNPAPLPPAI